MLLVVFVLLAGAGGVWLLRATPLEMHGRDHAQEVTPSAGTPMNAAVPVEAEISPASTAIRTAATAEGSEAQRTTVESEFVAQAPDPSHPVQGRVLDEGGGPVPDATIWVTQGNSSRLGFKETAARSDSEGRFSLVAPRFRVFGLLAVAEHRGGAVGGTFTLLEREGLDVVLRFRSEPRVGGRVILDGAPPGGRVAGDVAIDLYGTLLGEQFVEPDSEVRDRAEGFARLGGTRVDADGRFSFEGVVGKSLRLRATGKDHEGTTWIGFAEHVVVASEDVLIRLRPAGSVALVVTDDRGLPVEDFRVQATPLFESGPSQWDPEEKLQPFTSSGGAATMEELFAGRWRLRVHAEGHCRVSGAEWPVVHVPSADPLFLRLARLASLAGSVRAADGSASAGVPVSLWQAGQRSDRPRAKTTTDREGRFSFEGLDPGSIYSIQLNEATARARSDVALRPGERNELAPLTLEGGGDLRVTVFDAAGERWAKRPVLIIRRSGGSSRPTPEQHTDDEGELLLSQVPPGRVLVLASGKNRVAVTGSPEDAELMRAELDVVAGRTEEVELHAVTLAEIRFRGTVRVDGELAPGRGVSFLRDGAMRIESGSGHRTDSGGAYSASVPMPGLYRWTVAGETPREPAVGTGLVEITGETREGVDLEVRTGSLEISSASPSPSPSPGATDWTVMVTPRCGALAGDQFLLARASAAGWSLDRLRPGPYRIRAIQAPDKVIVASQEIEIEESVVTRVALEPMELTAIELDLGALLSAESDVPNRLSLAVWGEGPELLSEIPLRPQSGSARIQLPLGASYLAVAAGERLATCELGPHPWPERVELVATEGGRIEIQLPRAGLTDPGSISSLLDSSGRNWAHTPSGITQPWPWMAEPAVVGRWTSPPLPPGDYTLEAEGLPRRIRVRAREWAQVETGR
ncbi:carboxypeptidase-like regulatory domain-containing protein [Planctomycetes bacterium Poly30]|uniref:carboxypeptidase-like regulatory domain-containing protein n=1 Tax=Saltatorellus ferox TaxID=2528018 RepID=UPI00119FD7E2